MSDETETPEHSTHFAVPPIAIPVGDEPLVVYGSALDIDGKPFQVRLQCAQKEVVVSYQDTYNDDWVVYWKGTWFELIQVMVAGNPR